MPLLISWLFTDIQTFCAEREFSEEKDRSFYKMIVMSKKGGRKGEIRRTGTLTAKVNNIIIGKHGNKQWPKTYKSRYTYTQMYMLHLCIADNPLCLH